MYYLSPENEKLIPPLLKLLQHPEKGEVVIEANSPRFALYLLRAAANTKYPELKQWRFKLRESHVLCIPRVLIVSEKEIVVPAVDDYLDYISVVAYITEHKPDNVRFTNCFLTEKEFSRLVAYGIRTNYDVLKEDSVIRVTKNEKRNESEETG